MRFNNHITNSTSDLKIDLLAFAAQAKIDGTHQAFAFVEYSLLDFCLLRTSTEIYLWQVQKKNTFLELLKRRTLFTVTEAI